MSGLNRSDLQTLRAQTIYKNGQQKIKGQDHTNFLIDLIDSCANLITDKEKLNIYEYNNSLAYSSGVGVLYSGGLYQANKDTGLGAFNVADWNLISSGGGSSIFKGEWITLTAYAIGDFVVEAGDMYVCTTGNTDASFTPSNWLKVIEGNVTQATSTLAFDDGSTNTDWDGNVFPALQGPVNNQLASRVKTIENSLPIVKEFPFFFNTSSPTSNEVPSYGTVDIFGTERQDGSITSVEYETSTDKINWTNRGNLGGLDFFMSGATSTTFLWIRAVNPVVTGLGEKGFIVQYN